jgi:hypothetical protein
MGEQVATKQQQTVNQALRDEWTWTPAICSLFMGLSMKALNSAVRKASFTGPLLIPPIGGGTHPGFERFALRRRE